ncbi:MAG: rhomboid family intramembrane serine protease [Pseudomonadota bacterium]
MFPIRDHNASMRVPFVTWALIAANVVIFLLYFPQLSARPAALFEFYDTWALRPMDVSNGEDLHTLVTSMFLHGGWLHLAGNMLFLWIFGDNIEDLLGHVGYLLFYLASGVAAAAGQWIADPNSTIPVVGASGAIAGVMGAYLLMFPRARVDILVFLLFFIRVFTIPAWVVLGLWFALQIVSAFATDPNMGGVAYWAHAIGFIAGFLLIIPLWLARGGPDWWASHGGHPPHGAVRYRSGVAGVPRVVRHGDAGRPARPLRDITRVPRAGRRAGQRPGPWSGGRR